MPTDPIKKTPAAEPAVGSAGANARGVTPAAARALAEAAARRAEGDRNQAAVAKESGGRGGLDPVRYGDWEVNGLSSDF